MELADMQIVVDFHKSVKTIVISIDRQLTGGREPGPVIPGLPARAEPGIQGLLELFSGFRVPLRGPGMTG